ncbi:MAG: F-type H+-transporting ATPase subunit delta [Lentimonas sp.]|jgi:F-type H+-transporting ATPase subunit delta
MKRHTKTTQLAKKLVQLSKQGDVVTDAKVGEVLAALKQVQHSHPLELLKTYLSYIRREVALQSAVVSTPGTLSADALQALEAKFSKIYGRTIRASVQTDTSLIAGVRVRVGDDVYDASLSGRLQRLAENVN